MKLIALCALVTACSSAHDGFSPPEADAGDSSAPHSDAESDAIVEHDASADAGSDADDRDGAILLDAGSTMFACGATVCDSASEICTLDYASDGGVLGWCANYPGACGSSPSCSCITLLKGCTCSQSGADITVECH